MDLQKKIGPLPAWGWAGVTVIPAGLFILYRRKKAAAAAAAAANTSGAAGGNVSATGLDTAATSQYPGSTSYYVDYAPTVTGSAVNTSSQTLQQKLMADIDYLSKAERDYGANNAWVQYGTAGQKAAGAKALPADANAIAKTRATILSELSGVAAQNLGMTPPPSSGYWQPAAA